MPKYDLYLNGKFDVRLSELQLPHHTPKKTGDRAWKIVCVEDGTTIDSYTPYRPKPDKPITPYSGSWAESMQKSNDSC